jgi:hypothetical protein
MRGRKTNALAFGAGRTDNSIVHSLSACVMGKLIGGLSLGKSDEPSALVIVDRTPFPDPNRVSHTINRFDVRHIWRWNLGTKYPDIVSDLREWYARPVLRDSVLVVDGTGVGKAVTDTV